MTPEEKAVIDAAINWLTGTRAKEFGLCKEERFLTGAVQSLIYACPQCNAGGHICPGDGNPISHTATDCGQHQDVSPQHAGADGQCPDYGSTLDPCPPGCASGVCVVGRPRNFAPNPVVTDGEPRWTPATFLYVLAGDRIRIGTDETDVLRSSSGAWHANVVSSVMPSGKVWDKITPWEHTKLRLDLSANPGFREYPADTPCEILCTPERLAVLTLMTVFPGTKEIKP